MKRIYRVPVYVIFDDEEADLVDPDYALDDVATYIEDALVVDLNIEDAGNPYGVLGASIFKDEIETLLPGEVAKIMQKAETDIPGDD